MAGGLFLEFVLEAELKRRSCPFIDGSERWLKRVVGSPIPYVVPSTMCLYLCDNPVAAFSDIVVAAPYNS